MPHLPSRKSLENMKRVDLQRICKEYGVKANLKSEALIDLLLDTQSPRVQPPPQPHVQPPIHPTRRSTSTRLSTKAGPSRISSMIIHDTDEEADDESATIPEESPTEEPAEPPPVPPPRTRKAKELQKRLGVGKPVIAGGEGPRVITRGSGSLKRTKSNRAIRPREETIQEEPEPQANPPEFAFDHHWNLDTPVAESSHQLQPEPVPSASTDVNQLIQAAIAPLQEQIRQLKSELAITGELKSEIQAIKTQLAHATNAREGLSVRLDGLASVANAVATLQEEMAELKVAVEGGTPPRPSTPKGKNPRFNILGFGLPSTLRVSGEPPPAFEPPGTPTQPTTSTTRTKKPPTTLGKRPRDPTPSLQVADAPVEGSGTQAPLRKKPKLGEREASTGPSGKARNTETLPEGSDAQLLPGNHATGPAFAVFADDPNFLEAPPSDMPDYFREPSPVPGPSNGRGTRAASGAPITSTANAIENQQNPFAFPFPPMQYPNFSLADDPATPSPPSHNDLGLGDGRGLIFKSYGHPHSSTTRSRFVSTEGRTMDPSSLALSGGQQGSSSSRDTAGGSLDTDGGTRKTMYGTEMETDTRFGDFGVDGVATSGFWPYT